MFQRKLRNTKNVKINDVNNEVVMDGGTVPQPTTDIGAGLIHTTFDNVVLIPIMVEQNDSGVFQMEYGVMSPVRQFSNSEYGKLLKIDEVSGKITVTDDEITKSFIFEGTYNNSKLEIILSPTTPQPSDIFDLFVDSLTEDFLPTKIDACIYVQDGADLVGFERHSIGWKIVNDKTYITIDGTHIIGDVELNTWNVE